MFQFPFVLGIPLLPARRVIGIDPGTRRIRVALVEFFAGRARLLECQALELPSRGVDSQFDTADRLRVLLKSLGDYPVAIAVPQSVALSQIIDLPRVDESRVQGQIAEETRKLGGLSESALVYDYTRIHPFPGHPNPFWITLCQEAEIENLLNRLGIDREDLCDVAASANARLTGFLAVDPEIDRVILVDVGASTTQVTFILAGQAVQAVSLPSGGDAFTEAVAAQQRCSFEAAEALKNAEPLLDGDNASPGLQHAVKEWHAELERLFQEWQDEHKFPASNPPRPDVILTGGGAALPGLLRYLNQTGAFHYDAWPQSRRRTFPIEGEYSAACGAALQALGCSPQPASLLPADLRRKWRSQRSVQLVQSLCVALLIVVTVLLGLAVWKTTRVLDQKNAFLREAGGALSTARKTQRTLRQLEAEFDRLRPVLERQHHTRDLLEALRAIQQAATNRPLWFVLFGDEPSYLQAPPMTNGTPAASTNFLGNTGTTNAPAPLRSVLVAELSILQEGDAMRRLLTDVVDDLKKRPVFFNVDSLPSDRRRALIDPKLVLAERHFALALQLRPNEFAPPQLPADRAAKPPTSTPAPAPVLGPMPFGPPNRRTLDPSGEKNPNP